jgi:hypothetical protein
LLTEARRYLQVALHLINRADVKLLGNRGSPDQEMPSRDLGLMAGFGAFWGSLAERASWI